MQLQCCCASCSSCTCAAAGLQVRAALDDMDNMSNGEVLQGMYKTNPKTEKQVRGEARPAVQNHGPLPAHGLRALHGME